MPLGTYSGRGRLSGKKDIALWPNIHAYSTSLPLHDHDDSVTRSTELPCRITSICTDVSPRCCLMVYLVKKSGGFFSINSPEPKAHRCASWIGRHPASVRRHHRLQITKILSGKVQVGNGQETVQLERDSHSKKRGGKKLYYENIS